MREATGARTETRRSRRGFVRDPPRSGRSWNPPLPPGDRRRRSSAEGRSAVAGTPLPEQIRFVEALPKTRSKGPAGSQSNYMNLAAATGPQAPEM